MKKFFSTLGKIIFLVLEVICIFMSFVLLMATFSLSKTLAILGLWYIASGLFICSILGMFNGAVAIGMFLKREDD